MAIVKMHQASDGSLHATFDAYVKHEESLKIVAGIEAAGLNTFSGYGQDDRGNQVIFSEPGATEASIADFIVANAETLRNILNNAVVSKRGRKNAAA
jgi:hypothetical protein